MSFDDRFRGQVALVTGGASGIGLGIARRFAKEGGNVVLADISEEALAGLFQSFDGLPGSVTTRRVDVTAEQDVRGCVDDVVSEYGKLDIAVNSAGIVGPTSTNIESYEAEQFRRALDANLVGSFLVTKYAVQAMLPRGYGRILMLASIAGKDGNPGMAGYSASKAGVIGLVKGVAKEYAHTHITVNALAPALIETPLMRQISPEQQQYMTARIPMGRLGTIDEAAALACWICSKEASFNTGVIFDLSGGRATH